MSLPSTDRSAKASLLAIPIRCLLLLAIVILMSSCQGESEDVSGLQTQVTSLQTQVAEDATASPTSSPTTTPTVAPTRTATPLPTPEPTAIPPTDTPVPPTNTPVPPTSIPHQAPTLVTVASSPPPQITEPPDECEAQRAAYNALVPIANAVQGEAMRVLKQSVLGERLYLASRAPNCPSNCDIEHINAVIAFFQTALAIGSYPAGSAPFNICGR